MTDTVINRLQSYIEPLVLILVAIYGGLLATIQMIVFRKSPQDLFSPSKFQQRMFGQFWLKMGPMFAARERETVLPSLIAQASGTVLEVGPGSGNQLCRLDPSKITKVFGVEPTLDLHEQLRTSVKKAGLTDVYTIVSGGIDDTQQLRKYGIEKGSIDTLLVIQVLCCVPQPDKTARELYELLKPGGQMIVYEHVRSEDRVSKFVQDVYNTVWPILLGNCHLNRTTAKTLINAGKWARVELVPPTKDEAWLVIPRVSGRLVKAK